MRIALLEDDKREAEQFQTALAGWDPTRRVEWFTGGAALIGAHSPQEPFTVAFLDIYLPKEDGIEIANRLKEISPETEIVFTTTSKEHAVAAFGVGAVHYLVKPVTTEDICMVFARIAEKAGRQRPMLTVKTGRELRTVFLEKLVALSSANHATELQLSGGERVLTATPLGELQPLLDGRFVKVRRGLVLNMEYIETMTSESCRLFNGEEVLLSRKDRVGIRDTYHAWVFGRLSRGGGK